MPNSPKRISNTDKAFKKYPEHDASILGSLVQLAVTSMSGTSNNIKVNSVVRYLFRVVHT